VIAISSLHKIGFPAKAGPMIERSKDLPDGSPPSQGTVFDAAMRMLIGE